MKTHISLCVLACVVVVALGTGCASFSTPSVGGVSRGVLLGDVTYPGYLNGHTQVELDTDDFEILKTVTAETSSTNFLGIVGSGDSGYLKLFEKARDAGADDVVNIKVDTRRQSILAGFYTKSTTTLMGTAIRWKK